MKLVALFLACMTIGAAADKQYVRVNGLVVTPGAYEWTSGMTVADAVRLAGGMSDPKDDPEDMYLGSWVERVIDGRPMRTKVNLKFVLQPGDTLMVGRDLRAS